MSEKLLNIISVSYEYRTQFKVFIGSLMMQTSNAWTATLINDGPDPIAKEIVEREIEFYKNYYEEVPIIYLESEKRYGDWGHSLRAWGLELNNLPYTMWNNSDNYLMPKNVEMNLQQIREKDLDLLLYYIVHNYPNITGRGEPPYSVLPTSPWLNACDISSFIVKTELAKKVGFNHRTIASDGYFINDLMKTNPKWDRNTSILGVHN
jgi:hypothetical protein